MDAKKKKKKKKAKRFWSQILEQKEHYWMIECINNMENTKELQGVEEGSEADIHLESLKATQ